MCSFYWEPFSFCIVKYSSNTFRLPIGVHYTIDTSVEIQDSLRRLTPAGQDQAICFWIQTDSVTLFHYAPGKIKLVLCL